MTALPKTQQQLHSLVTDSGELQLSLVEVPLVAPGADEVVVRVEATPINPSDLGGLFAGASWADFTPTGTPGHPALTGQVPAAALPALRPRVGERLVVGNESAGVVVAAGSNPEAQHLLGKTVAHVMCGGDVEPGSLVDEDWILALEREAFVSLLQNPKTQERIMGMMQTGKPVRN